jgi:hypothetical protein
VEVALEAAALALRSLSDGSGTMPVRGARPRPLTPLALALTLALILTCILSFALTFAPAFSHSRSHPHRYVLPPPRQVRSVMRLPVEQLGLLASMPSCLGALAC